MGSATRRWWAGALAGAALALAGCGGDPRVVGGLPASALDRGTDVATAGTRGLRPLVLPAPRPGHAAATPVPVLMYHLVAVPPAGASLPDLWVDPALFARQVAALRAAGYHAVTLDRAWAAWHGEDRLPPHPVVLSFDDGYLSQYTHAARVLRAAGWPGVLDLEVHDVGRGGLTPYEVRAMQRAGWELAAHTVTHPDLTTLSPAQLTAEVGGSRAWLRRRFGSRVDAFCYPAGRFDAAAEAAVRRAGFVMATTTQEGAAAPSLDPLALPRVRVYAGEQPATLLAAVRAARPVQPRPGVAAGAA